MTREIHKDITKQKDGSYRCTVHEPQPLLQRPSRILSKTSHQAPIPLVQLEKWTEWWGREQQASSEAELVPELQKTTVEQDLRLEDPRYICSGSNC